ncbi:MAG: hypothetical protein FD123_2302 [Bacteroidetes bacterium]|nr:MAG: hypothetical protein FD123_2302 [Bacteroidota bacterium]
MKALARKWLFGITFLQEYVCLGENPSDPLHVFIRCKNNGRFAADDSCLFLGYKPVLFMLGATGAGAQRLDNLSEEIVMEFCSGEKVLAVLQLRRLLIQQLPAQGSSGTLTIALLESTHGHHRLEPGFFRFTNSIRQLLKRNNSGNLRLPGNLYEQVKIAYTIPRKVSLLTISDGTLFNLFSADLNGSPGQGYYVISLRHEGEACRQVEQSGKIAYWEMTPAAAALAYAQGKNHMKPLRDFRDFPFTENRSPVFGLPEPQGAVNCRELELLGSLGDYGVHRLLLFRIAGDEKSASSPVLHHVHRVYAEWRKRKGLPLLVVMR